MKRLILQRTESSDEGTFGKIDVDGQIFHTGELPWRQNRRKVSCIPSGIYQVKMERSPRFNRDLYELQDVPDRSDILIHSGNYCGDEDMGFASDVEGCILLGSERGVLRKHDKEQKAVCNSKTAVATFEAMLRDQPFELEIRDVEK